MTDAERSPPAPGTATPPVPGVAAVVRPPPVLPDGRWRVPDSVLVLVPVAWFFAFPDHLLLGSQVIITGLFALSVDLILGYAGIVSLGHAAFFGLGAYTAGLLAAHGWGEPLTGLACAGLIAAVVGYATSFLVVRGKDLSQLMITLGVGLLFYEAANKAASVTGGSTGCPMSRCGAWAACCGSISRAGPRSGTASRSRSPRSWWSSASSIRHSACRCARSARARGGCRRWGHRSAGG